MTSVNGYPECGKLLLYILAGMLLLPAMAFAESISVQVLGANGTAAEGIAVYIESLDGRSVRSSSHVSIDILQKDKAFTPYLSLVQVGTTVSFSNLDDITHHIYSVSGNKHFSHTVRAGKKTGDMKLEKTGIIAMGCNIHDWMSGYLLVVETPYYELTDSQGLVVFDLPDSVSYRAVAWHPQMNDALSKVINLNSSSSIVLQMKHKMSSIPHQKGIDDFDFLEGY